MNYHDAAALLLEIRTNPNTDPSVLKSDWLPMTVKGASGGETWTMRFFTIRGEEIATSLDVTLIDTTEYSLAQMLKSGSGDDSGNVTPWAALWYPSLGKVAYIAFPAVSGTVYVGRGATSNEDAGIVGGFSVTDGPTFTVTGPAADTTVLLANANYGIGA